MKTNAGKRSLTRREVLQLGAAAAGLGALAPVLGCAPSAGQQASSSSVLSSEQAQSAAVSDVSASSSSAEGGSSAPAENSAAPVSDPAASAERGASGPAVYFAPDISPAGLVAVYQALGVQLPGKVGVKITTGQSERTNYLRPDFIADLVHLVEGDIVECNTAFGGSRGITESHYRIIEERGFPAVANTVILDGEADMELPVALDCACADLVYAASDGADLVARIDSLNGWHTLEYGQQIGLGSMDYTLIPIA